MLADAINDAFARWDRSHLHASTFDDGSCISIRGPWEEADDDDSYDTKTTLSRLNFGELFEFEFGDSSMHLCTVAEEEVDRHEVYGEAPEHPAPYWGAGLDPRPVRTAMGHRRSRVSCPVATGPTAGRPA